MKKNNVMTIRVPEDLKERIENVALLQGVSINQFAVYAFTKELSELENSQYFKKYLREKKKDEIEDFIMPLNYISIILIYYFIMKELGMIMVIISLGMMG